MRESFFARRGFAIVLIVMFILPFIGKGTRQAIRSNCNDMRDWLPDGFAETSNHRWFQKHFPHEQFVLVSWEGCTLNDPRLELFARKLVPPKPKLEPDSESDLEPSLGSNFEPPQPIALDTNRPETSSSSDSILGSILNPNSASDPTATAASGTEPPRLFRTVLTGRRLVDQLQQRYQSLTEEDILERLEGSLIGPDHLKTCLVVTLTPEAGGKKLRSTVNEIRRIAHEECNIKPEEIRLGGPPVDNVAIDVEGERTLYNLAFLSAIVGLGVSMFCFRSVRLTVLVFWVAVLSAGMGLAIVYFTGSTADAILMTMPSLLYVLAISGAIHIVNYYHDAIREHGLDGAADRAVGYGLRPCAIASLTTALGLGSLMASNLIPISKFGIYSAAGVLATLLLLFLYLPALLHFFPSRQFAERCANTKNRAVQTPFFVRLWQRVGRTVIRHNILVSAGCLVLMVVFAVGVTKMRTSVNLMKMFSADAEIIAHYGWLEEHLGPLVPMEVVIKIDNQKNNLSFVERMRLAQDVERAVEKLDAVGGALSAATFAPDIRPETRGPNALERMIGSNPRVTTDGVLNSQMEPHRDEFRDYLTYDFTQTDALLETQDPTLEELQISAPFAKCLAARKLTTLTAIERYAEIEYIKGIGPEGAAAVTDAIREWRIAHGEELWRVCARVDALTDMDYADFLADLEAAVEPVLEHYRKHGAIGIEGVYTGLVPLVYKAQHELLGGLYESLAWAFVLIAAVMVIVLRSPSAGLMSMIPNLFPVVMVFGMMGWLRVLCLRMGWPPILVDAGSMMTASVALGVAVDDTIHYLIWYRKGLDQGLDRQGAVMLAYERCAMAMSQTTLIAGFGLAMFAFSTFTPTQRFGTLMLFLLFAALVGDLIFLPALLTSPLGRFFGGHRKKKTSKPDESLQTQSDDVAKPTPVPAKVNQAKASRVSGNQVSGNQAAGNRRTDGAHAKKPLSGPGGDTMTNEPDA